MRALFALAVLLGTTVAALSHSLSAQEFNRWRVWMAAEHQGPEWADVRHAELLAAIANGPRQRTDKRPFTGADFIGTDPWAPPPRPAAAMTPEEMAAAHAAWIAELER